MQSVVLPVFLFAAVVAILSVGMLVVGRLFGPRRTSPAKEMPYESGMDPVHDTRRRFDIRFHLVAIAFLVFDVELLFLYPWAVAAKSVPAAEGAGQGIDAAVAEGLVADRMLVFWGVAVFFVLLLVGFIYDWRKGIFQWR